MADNISERIEKLVQDIQNVSSLGPSFIYDVWKLLESYGYEVQDSDDWLIGFCVQKVENTIRNKCNTLEIPQGLKKLAAQMIVGEFFFAKKGMGQLDGFDLNLDAVANEIKEGDTDVKFAIGLGSSTPEQRLNAFISYLIKGSETEFAKYRRVQW